MDLSKLKEKLTNTVSKYKYIILILCAGVLLILLPTGSTKQSGASVHKEAEETTHISQEALAAILRKINGAGRVEVLLSIENSAQTDYQLDFDSSSAAKDRVTTVTVTDAQRNENGLIKKTNAPTYRGAIIVCDGADNPDVRLSVVYAVSNITGLRSDQISVLKMK